MAVDHEYVAKLHALARAAEREAGSALTGRPQIADLLKAMATVSDHLESMFAAELDGV